MKYHCKYYSMNHSERKAVILTVLAIALAGILTVTGAVCEDDGLTECWVLCQPGDYVNIRMNPSKKSPEVGFLECGGQFWTDGKTKDGWVKCMGAGDIEGWIHSGYVVFEKPTEVGERYVCLAKRRVACRRWIDGPQVATRPWLANGSNVTVFYEADGWAVTSRGYIKSEWLGVDPE